MNLADQIQADRAGNQRQLGFVQSYIRLQLIEFALRHIRRIANDEIKLGPGGQSRKAIA